MQKFLIKSGLNALHVFYLSEVYRLMKGYIFTAKILENKFPILMFSIFTVIGGWLDSVISEVFSNL